MSSKARIFLSYSRRDRETMLAVVSGLEAHGFDPQIDTDDIAPGEEWRKRLAELISSADTVVFLLSEHSARSEVCAWEVAESLRQSKRIFPFVTESLGEAVPPSGLSDRNWIDARGRALSDAVDALAEAIRTDLPWVREHTRLAELAAQWDERKRRPGYLLRGDRLNAAEAWVSAPPHNANQPTDLHRAFIAASRQGATRRLRYGLAGALGVAAIAGGLAIFAELNRREAVIQRGRADQSYAAARQTVDDLVFNITGGLANQEGLSSATIQKILATTEKSVDQLMVQNPGDPKLFRTQTVMLSQAANIYARAKMWDSAKATYELAAKRVRIFIDVDPANPTWKIDLGMVLGNYSVLAGEMADEKLRDRLLAESHHLRVEAHRMRPGPETAAALGASYRALADIDVKAGRLVAAQEKLSAARDLISGSESSAGIPANEQAEALESLGQIEMNSGRKAEAAKAFGQAVDMRRRFLSLESDNLERKSGLAYALVLLGDAEDAPQKAKPFVAEANSLFMDIYLRDRDNARHANQYFASLTRLASIERKLKNPKIALMHLDDAEEVLKFLLGVNKNDVNYIYRQAVLQGELGAVSIELGDHQDALDAFELALEADRKLVALQPGSAIRLSGLALTLDRITDVLLQMDEPAKALVRNDEAARIHAELMENQKDNAGFRSNMAMNHLRRSMLVANVPEKRVALQKALELLRALERGGNLSPEQMSYPAIIAAEIDKLTPR